MLEAMVTERVRVLGRSVNSKHVYELKGQEHAKGIQEYLKKELVNKGINVKSLIITNVLLPEDVAFTIQEKTIF